MAKFQGAWKLHAESTVIEKSRWEGKGLKSMRGPGKTPDHGCSNCKCKRYSPCTCMKPDVTE